jgi:hypothetical protein
VARARAGDDAPVNRARRAAVQAACLLAALAVAILAGIVAELRDRSRLTAMEIADARSRLRSLAAEGAMLREQASRAPATFVRVHSEGLAEEARRQGELLSRGAPDDPAAAQAGRDAAAALADELGSIGASRP